MNSQRPAAGSSTLLRAAQQLVHIGRERRPDVGAALLVDVAEAVLVEAFVVHCRSLAERGKYLRNLHSLVPVLNCSQCWSPFGGSGGPKSRRLLIEVPQTRVGPVLATRTCQRLLLRSGDAFNSAGPFAV